MGCTQSTPVAEPVAAAPPSKAPASQQSVAAEPEVEAAPASNKATQYAVNGVSITEQGVVYYHIEATDGSVSIKRRFNDFKALYAGLGAASGLPALPESGLSTVLGGGRHSQELIKQRETRFAAIVNAIGNSPALYDSAAFKKFISA